jgi:hypothetical protein
MTLTQSARIMPYNALAQFIYWLTVQMDDAREFGFRDAYDDARHARGIAIARVIAIC